MFWNLKFVSSKMRNSFVRLAILDWNELPTEIKTKQDKKFQQAAFSSAQFLS